MSIYDSCLAVASCSFDLFHLGLFLSWLLKFGCVAKFPGSGRENLEIAKANIIFLIGHGS